jgi:hypothetical protein
MRTQYLHFKWVTYLTIRHTNCTQKNHKFFKLQLKTASFKKETNNYEISCRTFFKFKEKKFTDFKYPNIDFFIFNLIGRDISYVIPSSEIFNNIKPTNSIRFTPDRLRSQQSLDYKVTSHNEEYREAFEKLYAEISKTPENTVIINTGDTLHSKVDLSPEAVQITSEFFHKLSELRPTIIIAGNHDCLLTNATRLDSISPIVDNLKHKKLFYLKNTGLYGAANLLINNMSVFDDVTKYIKLKNVTKKIKTSFDTKIALYHGGVLNARTDIGYAV